MRGPRSVPPAPLRGSDPSVASLRTTQALDAEEETWERGPGRAQAPAPGASLMSLGPWDVLSPEQRKDYTVWGSVVKAAPRLQLSGSEGREQGGVTATSQTAVIVCTCYLNASNVRKVLLDPQELSMHSSQVKGCLCPPITSERVSSTG